MPCSGLTMQTCPSLTLPWQASILAPSFAGSIGLLLQVSTFLWPLVYSPSPSGFVKNKMNYSALKRKRGSDMVYHVCDVEDVQTVLFLSLRVVHMGVLALENFIRLGANVL